MRNKFEMQLEVLNEKLSYMGSLCELAIKKATGALKCGDKEKAKEVIKADEEIDQIEKDIEAICLKLLLQQQPVARDLRQISAALKMITDMERIGDQASDIAEILISTNVTEIPQNEDVYKMAKAVSQMVIDSVTAYVQQDLKLAGDVLKADDEVDAMFDKIKGEMISFIRQDKGVEGAQAIDLMMIVKYLERIGDHATNIAEWVEFSITGIHQS